MTTTDTQILPQDILDRCLERAPGYDQNNSFFTEDFDAAVPKELGGQGLNLAEIVLSNAVWLTMPDQRRWR